MRGFVTDKRDLPFDPAERFCDFCEAAATGAIEICDREDIGTGQWVYGCVEHARTAADSVIGRRKTLRQKRRQGTKIFEPGKLGELT